MKCFDVCKGQIMHRLTCFTPREDVFHHLVTICSHVISYLLLIAYLLSLKPAGLWPDIVSFVSADICDSQAVALKLHMNYLNSNILNKFKFVWIANVEFP